MTNFGAGCYFFEYSLMPFFGTIGLFGIWYAIYTFYAISISTLLPNAAMARSDTNLLTDAVYNAFENFSHVNDD